jgi:hypothetical protein
VLPIVALLSTNLGSLALDAAPVVPLVPVGADEALSMHPVTVMSFDELLELLCDAGVCAAMATVATPTMIAAHVPDQNLVIVAPPFSRCAIAMQL